MNEFLALSSKVTDECVFFVCECRRLQWDGKTNAFVQCEASDVKVGKLKMKVLFCQSVMIAKMPERLIWMKQLQYINSIELVIHQTYIFCNWVVICHWIGYRLESLTICTRVMIEDKALSFVDDNRGLIFKIFLLH